MIAKDIMVHNSIREVTHVVATHAHNLRVLSIIDYVIIKNRCGSKLFSPCEIERWGRPRGWA